MNLRVSVVIPCYNGAAWLPETMEKAAASLTAAGISEAEFVVVDDGSTDGSAEAAGKTGINFPVQVIMQRNSGRFLARKAGVEKAKFEHIFFLDTRVHMHRASFRFICEQLAKYPEKQIWNGHVYVHKQGNIIARFMDAVTLIGWRRYFGNPRTTSYGLEDFDYYPKGTGCFFAPKKVILAAIKEFEKEDRDLRFSSDDTHLIRIMAKDYRINLSPEFACTYFARNTLKAFVKHTYHRGQFFVDGFLRRGTRFFWLLIFFYLLSTAGLVIAVVRPLVFVYLLIAAAICWFIEFIVAVMLGLSVKDSASLFSLTPVFVCFYGAGIWRGLLRKSLPNNLEEQI